MNGRAPGAAWPALVLLAWLVLAIAAPWMALEPNVPDLANILAAPSSHLLLGADDLGRPVLDRLLSGAWTSFSVSVSVVLICALLGTAVGLLAGFFGGWVDRLLMWLVDVFLAFPGMLLAIALAAILGPGISNVIIALAVVGWVGFARLVRAQTLAIREREHIQAAQAFGVSTPRILRRHVLPLLAAPIIVEASFGIAAVIIAEAGLSFLGLGVQAPEASWGSMIRDGTRYLLVAPHLVIAPVVALGSVVISVNLLGDRLRDRLDPRS